MLILGHDIFEPMGEFIGTDGADPGAVIRIQSIHDTWVVVGRGFHLKQSFRTRRKKSSTVHIERPQSFATSVPR